MRVVLAPNSFKGSLSAPEASAALARGLARTLPGAALEEVPIADGGEGTVEALVRATDGSLRSTEVEGPVGEPVHARWGVLGDGQTAVVELAAASGLELVPPDRRAPMIATTFGTGSLIRTAAETGFRHLLVALGGSATTDGGAGLAQALGARLLDAAGRDIPRGGGALCELDRIDPARLPSWQGEHGLTVRVACDVRNPLLGAEGAARTYGPQKGATPAEVERLERGLERFAHVVERDLGVRVADLPGGGAAGGTAAGLVAFLGARLEPGAALVLEAVGLEQRLRGASLVITGEGRLDGQTRFEKGPLAVVRLARRLGVPAVIVAGSVAPEAYALEDEEGVQAILSVSPGPLPLPEALRRAPELLERAGAELGRLLALGRSLS